MRSSASCPGRAGWPAAGAAVLLGAAIFAGCTSGGPSSATASSTTPSATATTLAATGSGSAEAVQQTFVNVLAKVHPQVVEISTTSDLGSGVVYDANGDIVTDAHVVGSATSFTVQLADGQQPSAGLVGVYAPDDLAVIRVTGARDLSPATFADSTAVQVGDIVFAVGNPLGLAGSVTEGIVSYNGREVSEGNGITLPSTIQTSAAINHGNRGGALVALSGRVVGVPALAALDPQEGGAAAGIGFAIPSNTVELIAPQLIAAGHVTRSDRAALDIAAGDAVDPAGRPAGVLIMRRTSPGGSAAKAGIAPGDVITAINDQKVTSLAFLQAALSQITPGASVTVTITDQNGATRTVTAITSQLAG